MYKKLKKKIKKLKKINKLLATPDEVVNNYIDVSKTDLRGIITYVSDMFCETMGYTKDELIGQPHSIVRAPHNSQKQYKKLWKTIKKGKVYTNTIQNRAKNGDLIWFEVLIRPEYNKKGKKIGYIAYRKNITTQKNLQEMVQKQIEQIREKDRQLYEQAKIKAMGDVIKNIAHHWRQPLSVISTVSSGISLKIEYDMFNKDEALNDLKKVEEATQFLSNTIEEFSNFISQSKIKSKFLVVDVIKKSLKIMEASLTNSGIKTIFLDIDNSVEITSYENELSQALLNILHNAQDALDQVEPEEKYIFISLEKKDKNIIISIMDNAKGIEDSAMPHIFEPYFTTKHKSLGTGMGLYITNKIIQTNFDGKIEVHNKTIEYMGSMCMGASFSIVIPNIEIEVEDN